MSILRIETPRAFKPLLAPKRYKGAYGGRASGKSHFFGESVIERCVAERTRIVCIREVQNSIKDSVKQLVEDKIQSLNVGPFFEITDKEIRGENGSLIIFRGLKDANAENIKSLESYDVAWVEEAQTLSQKSLNLLRPTIRKDGSELWFSWNPRNATDPVDEFFRKRPPKDAISIMVNYNDNPWLPKALWAEMEEDRARDPETAAHVWDGAYEAAPKGSYYGLELAQAEAEGRITDILIDPALPMHTAWDLGVAGNMCTWCFQIKDGQFFWHKFFEYAAPGLPHATGELNAYQIATGFNWGTHLWPHDGKATDPNSGEMRYDIIKGLGYPVETLPRPQSIGPGIEQVRRMLKLSRWNRDGCRDGLAHLKGYTRKHDRVHNRFLEEPDKNGHDHCADAKRVAATGQHLLRNVAVEAKIPTKVMDFKASWVA